MNLSPNSEIPDQSPPTSAAPHVGAPGTIPPLRVDDAAGKPLKVKKRGKVWKVLGLTLLIGGASSAAYLTQTKHGQEITQAVGEARRIAPIVWEAKQNPELVFQQEKSDVVNILLVGRDQNYKQVYKNGVNVAHEVDTSTPARSDTMIIVSLDRLKHTIRMVSLPRDAMIHLPPNKYDVRLAKLNAAHAYGGVELLEKTLHDELGITIHHHAVIKFDGFMKLVDDVGGVYVDVIGALHRDGTRRNLIYNDSWAIPPLHIDLRPGKQVLDGKQAHAYVRFRMDLEGDTGRIRRQQSLMRALAQKLKTLQPTELPGVMKTIREQFETDMDDSQLASTGFFAKDLKETSKMQPITLYGSYTERGGAKLNRSKNKALLAAIFGPTFNPENFMQHSPTVRGYEFGPDETKPDTRELLREAGLIEGEPRVAASGSVASSLDPGGFAATPASPLSLAPGMSASAPTAAPDPFTFTAPDPDSAGASASEPDRPASRSSEPRDEARSRAGDSDSDEERPRRRRSRSSSRSRTSSRSSSRSSSRRGRASDEAASEPQSDADASDSGAQSPIPQPESSDSSGDLSVESPIPQPEQ